MANSWKGAGAAPDWLPPSTGNWNGMTPLRIAAGKLRVLQKYDFQRACLPYLQVILSGQVTTAPEMGALDARGIDHIAWRGDDATRAHAVFQCKGFSVDEAEIGASQASQCVGSIERFASADIAADGYVIVHNRDNGNFEFRKPVLDALAALRAGGGAAWTALWDRHDLLRVACNALVPRIEQAWRVRDDKIGDRMRGLLGVGTVEHVPLRTIGFGFDRSDVTVTHFAECPVLRDPVDSLAVGLQGGRGVRLLLGGFGYGKTTAALRLADRLGRRAVVVPGALLSADRTDGRHTFWQAVDSDDLLAYIPSADFDAIEPLATVIAENLLRHVRDDIVLVVDGVDESPQANRSNGLAQLLNTVIESGAPVILTMRSEFWLARLAEVSGGLKQRFGGQTRRRTSVSELVADELTPWDDDQVLALVELAKQQVAADDDTIGVQRLDDLSHLLGTDAFVDTYGDIPRRPLFLRMLIADVIAGGIQGRSPVELVDSWIRQKLARDVTNPEAVGSGRHRRIGIGDKEESVATTVELAYAVMDAAAALTMRAANGEEDGAGETWWLGPELFWHELVERVPTLSIRRDLATTCTRTILAPLGAVTPGRRTRIAFAHRAIQEFFAARFIELRPSEAPSGVAPPAVADWTTFMRQINYP